MEEIKRIFKRALITSAIILVYGLLIRNKYAILGLFTGSIVSVVNFYLLTKDVQNMVAENNSKYSRSITGYLKRYLLSGVFLFVMMRFFGLEMLLSGALGLLNVKFNIYLMVLIEEVKKFKKNKF